MAHNSIHVAWAKGAASACTGATAEWPIAGAIVADNDLILPAPEGTDFDSNSAGIDIRGFAQDNLVLNNRIQGRARAALAVAAQDAGVPHNSTFLRNNLAGFQAALIEVFVEGARRTPWLTEEEKKRNEDTQFDSLCCGRWHRPGADRRRFRLDRAEPARRHPAFLRGVAALDRNTAIAVGEYGTILRTTDGGATWTRPASGTTNSALWRLLHGCQHRDSGRRVWGTILRTTDGGRHLDPAVEWHGLI